MTDAHPGRLRSRLAPVAAASILAIGVSAAGDAKAQSVPACARIPGTHVYIESGDTQENLLKVIGRQLRDTADITLMFVLTGSCGITSDMYTNSPIVGGTVMDYIPSSTVERVERPGIPTQPEANCFPRRTLRAIRSIVGFAALFVESCGLGDPPMGSNLSLIKGPIQAYTFVVPTASDESAVWAEEAYYAFGFGDANKLTPWNELYLRCSFAHLRRARWSPPRRASSCLRTTGTAFRRICRPTS